MPTHTEPQPPGSRGRAAFAVGAGLLLAVTVAAMLLLGGGGSPAGSSPAPHDCVRAWNGDAGATAYGRHNFNFHDYTGALVTHLTESAARVGEGEDGSCAVIFPSRALDPEPFAAGQVLRAGRWLPLTRLEGVDLTRVAELQAEAAQGPNATLDTTGKLTTG